MASNSRFIPTRSPFDTGHNMPGYGRSRTVFAHHRVFEPSLIEKIFILRGVLPFDRLTDGEIALVADVARAHAYPPGALVHSEGELLARLLVVAGGAARNEAGGAVGPLIGVASLLNHQPAPRLDADPTSGARFLEIARRHFLTLANECPEFVLGLLEVGERGARSR